MYNTEGRRLESLILKLVIPHMTLSFIITINGRYLHRHHSEHEQKRPREYQFG